MLRRARDPIAAAAEILDAAREGKPAVDLRRVCALWPNLKVTAENLEREGYLVDLGAMGAHIVLRKSDPLPRRRFTLAHELGHLLLAEHECANDIPEAFVVSSRTQIERWCDRFAVNLLMPAQWIRDELMSVGLHALPKWIVSSASRYKVSQRAFRLRVSELTAISLFEMAWMDGRIEIDHRYDSPLVQPQRLSSAIHSWMKVVDADPACYLQEQRLIAVHKAFTDRAHRGWLVCLLPSLDEQRSLEPRRQARERVGAP